MHKKVPQIWSSFRKKWKKKVFNFLVFFLMKASLINRLTFKTTCCLNEGQTKYVSCELILWMIGRPILLTANCWHPSFLPFVVLLSSGSKVATLELTLLKSWPLWWLIQVKAILPRPQAWAWPWNIAEKPTHYWKLPKKDQRIGAPNHFSHATAHTSDLKGSRECICTTTKFSEGILKGRFLAEGLIETRLTEASSVVCYDSTYPTIIYVGTICVHSDVAKIWVVLARNKGETNLL